MDYLPRSNDPGCSAGFGHGLVTGIAPEIQQKGAKAAAAEACGKAKTRYENYSCIHGFGHAFMRMNLEMLPKALSMCEQLGKDAPDCAQGAYHDYWFSISGFDGTKPARRSRSPTRACCAARSRTSSPARAGTARSWRPAAASACSRPTSSRRCATA